MDSHEIETAVPVTKTASDAMKKLSGYKLRHHYDLSFALVDENQAGASEQRVHSVKGTMEYSLCKCLAVFGMIALTVSLIKGLCCCFCKH